MEVNLDGVSWYAGLKDFFWRSWRRRKKCYSGVQKMPTSENAAEYGEVECNEST